VVQGVIYQIVFGDFGHARWSGQSMNATHVFTEQKHGGTKHFLSLDFPSSKCLNSDRESIIVVRTSDCSQAFGHRAKVEHCLEHPGAGTVTIRAPNYDRRFDAGQGADQRRFDQSADMWAVGIMGLRIMAPAISDGQGQPYDREQRWAERIRKASERAEKWICFAAGQQRHCSKRGADSLSGLLDARDNGSWIAQMVRQCYPSDSWPLLDGRMSGQEKSAWKSLLDLLEGLLRYNSDHRLTADRALKHGFFSAPNTAR
jgi:serine/threonine protein kinase